MAEEYSLVPATGVVPALKNTLLNEDAKSLAAEYLEIGIDTILENDALKGIPIVGTVASLCKTGLFLRERHYIKETLHFIVGFNEGTLSSSEFCKYEERITASEEAMEEELERVVLLLDSHINSNQSRRLGKFYAAFRERKITWDTFCELSEVNSRMYEADYPVLVAIGTGNAKAFSRDYRASRLAGNGLIMDNGPLVEEGTLTLGENNYECTQLGQTFLRCCR